MSDQFSRALVTHHYVDTIEIVISRFVFNRLIIDITNKFESWELVAKFEA